MSSRNCFAEVSFPHVVSFLSIHHEVLDHRPTISFSTICLCLQPCDVRGAERGAAAAFKVDSFLAFDLFFDFVLCDVGHFVFTQSHPVDILLVSFDDSFCVSHYF